MTVDPQPGKNPLAPVRAKSGSGAPPRRAQLEHDWTTLAGSMVEIRKGEHSIRSGRVECVASNGSSFWIEANGVEPRTMFTDRENLTIWINTGPPWK
ncbi:hypothetical protein QO003_000814 [Arthrobacter silviterrae]|uniref:Uncharacterized protein n=1 Tax=Arthrobacter silviterrae TaxID=2026658 RepID=A0ABX0DE16_9MICC|nr:hypothetical protein [Arthrobacter silviterrae]MDQ0276511.1 hypothetical protein [Arthrobacter silviterrae]NGN85177.1 hypothetical protein [Arthrobacter silviterrae]